MPSKETAHVRMHTIAVRLRSKNTQCYVVAISHCVSFFLGYCYTNCFVAYRKEMTNCSFAKRYLPRVFGPQTKMLLTAVGPKSVTSNFQKESTVIFFCHSPITDVVPYNPKTLFLQSVFTDKHNVFANLFLKSFSLRRVELIFN